VDFGPWSGRYDESPESAYLLAPDSVRGALDRRLLTDVLSRLFQAKADADPIAALDLATEAKKRLPEQPNLASQLMDRGLAAASANVGRLRQSELLALVARYNDVGQPDRGRALMRAWLDDQRTKKLGKNDADGRIALAEQYRALLGDRATAVTLLTEAAELDPPSAQVTEAFRRLGFRHDGKRWVETENAPQDREESRQIDAADPLIGQSPEEILSGRGKPDGRSHSITQGSVLIQWSYELPRGGVEYFNFIKRPGSPAVLESRYVVR
jgi:hypothetical protein